MWERKQGERATLEEGEKTNKKSKMSPALASHAKAFIYPSAAAAEAKPRRVVVTSFLRISAHPLPDGLQSKNDLRASHSITL